MGLNFGGGSQQSQANQTTSGTTSNVYSPGQSAIQQMLMSAFSSIIPGMATGTLSPNVAAAATGSADAINKTGTSTLQRIQQFLAARGMSGSGQSGQATLANALQTSANLGANQSAAAGQQLQLNSGYLSDALAGGFTPTGSSTSGTASGTSSGSGFNWGAGGSALTAGMAGSSPFLLGA
ncbi:MAG: hypothetical protein ABSG41_26055 [Bryobacteraceae bacterium]